MTALNEYIIKSAANGNGNYLDLLCNFGEVEVFFSIESPGDNLKDGPFVTSLSNELKMLISRPCRIQQKSPMLQKLVLNRRTIEYP